MRDYTASDEAKAVRNRRRQLQRDQRDDPLAKRAKLVAFWRKCAETNRGYIPHNGAWWWSFTTQPGFRWTLMPCLRAMLDARDKAHRDQYAAEMRESSRRWQHIKAERVAAKARAKAPQRDLIDEVAA